MKTSLAVKVITAVTAVLAPVVASADSNVASGAGTITATNYVDVQISIPQVLYFRVGSGSAYSTAAPSFTTPASQTVDLISFAPTAAQLGSGAPLNATSGGDVATGVETAAVIGNGGAITITASETGGMTNGGTDTNDTIPWKQIITTAGNYTSATTLAAPVLGTGTQSITANPPTKSNVVAQDAKWTFTYANTITPAAGTYGGANASTTTGTGTNNGRVTYTASMP